MNKKNNLTSGGVGKSLVLFAIPFLLTSFMQTFYGIVDLFIIGIYNGTKTTAAVSIGSQIMHMITVIVIGLVMGITVHVGMAVGASDEKKASKTVGVSSIFFMVLSIIATMILYGFAGSITKIMLTPVEAVTDTVTYLRICFLGIPFIMGYNIISSIFRGAGDSRRPMNFVGIACVINIALDIILIGGCHMGAAGAALGTIGGQAASLLTAFWYLKNHSVGFAIHKEDFRWDFLYLKELLKTGVPIAMQDGMIQVAFIIITVIANRRGLIASTAVGIVEKLIGFFFMVPSAFLSALSTVTAQNMGAGKPERARRSLRIALVITISYGIIFALYSQVFPETLVGLFTKDALVLQAGCQYLMPYSWDCAIAAVHFCFSGYFCGDQKSIVSFIHNILSVLLVRIPGAYFASLWYPETLYPMGMAAPLGSLLSVVVCLIFYRYFIKKEKLQS